MFLIVVVFVLQDKQNFSAAVDDHKDVLHRNPNNGWITISKVLKS